MSLKGFCYEPTVIKCMHPATSYPPSIECEWVTDPLHADFFMYPNDLGWVAPQDLPSLPYYEGNEYRHVFICTHDTTRVYNTPAIIFRCSADRDQWRIDPNTVAWPYAAADLKTWLPLPIPGFKYSAVFHGYATPLRIQMATICDRVPRCNIHIYLTPYHAIEHAESGKILRQQFLETMQVSRLALAPRGGGMSSYRVYEAMSMGRVPLIIVDDTHVLPFADKINYAECSIRVPSTEIHLLPNVINTFVQGSTDAQILTWGKRGREMWERYLNPADWPHHMAQEIVRRLK